MTTYEDLSPYSYTPSPIPMLNVGWLGADRPFETGAVAPEIPTALVRLAVRPANLMRGSHTCEFCHARDPAMIPAPGTLEGRIVLGSGEIHVLGLCGEVYAAPTLVVHYINAHGYQPPAPFIQALLALDESRTTDDEQTADHGGFPSPSPHAPN